MNREQAVTVIKELFDKCQLMEGKSIKLLPPKENDALSDTFQIHIQTLNNEMVIMCGNEIARRHHLAVIQKSGLMIIYKPYPNLTEP